MEKKLTEKIYIIEEILSTIWQIEIINKNKLVKDVLDKNIKVCKIYINSFTSIIIYLSQKSLIVLMINKKTTFINKYLYYVNVFLKKYAKILSKDIQINKYTVQIKKSNQPLYGFIYNLSQIEFEILKTYIKINLANGFIKFFKYPIKILIFFV